MTTPWRAIITVLLFLLIGAAINVGLAWATVLVKPGAAAVWISFAPMTSMQPWPEPVPHNWPAPERTVRVQSSWSDRVEVAAGKRGYPTFPGGVGGTWIVTHRAQVHQGGFPLRSLRGTAWSGPEGPPQNTGSRWAIPLTVVGGTDERMLPLSPIFPGFAINTLLYATLTATLWYTPGFIRRARRRRRNACLSCGYARTGLTTDTPCPECGGFPAR